MAHLHGWQLMLAGSSAGQVIWSTCPWFLHGAWTFHSMSFEFQKQVFEEREVGAVS